ncbi:MAG: c-type cytochrome [Gammaproteobacteria bacterium]|nr:c-type cytochrome [Gammaproteobacteria bacterium]MBU6509017.1 c-type cytochrome [Gammaproteobacteria bacterium]MDE1984037.1 c-type cytochrome [Gammaproteobacteria bacterium]MDE2108727.1 c-type cytochrome [Gammaproteobacteria bacterium]MDE2460322.1 c-type cytochrome [Gammaproteobacteria bacterium]
MKSLTALAILLLGAGLATTATLADDAPATGTAASAPPATLAWAAQHFKDTCSACHGADGAQPTPLPGNPPPIIAGQYRDYLVQALTEYRDGQRQNIIMAPQAKALNNAQIRALAAYISSLPTPLHTLPRPEFGH